ncbi:MAG TPA: hypothetical protein VNV44_09975 [Solirubrobacteraceae bacterium]|jgi:hypothetical protein|nr:hypothetical protein [Solirubrobacteraceae bacterium]
MSDWQERITHETPPAIRSEHELRYRTAAPLIASAACWADLGCGNGIAAAAALAGRRPARAVLVDLDEQTVATAAGELGIAQARTLACDLSAPADLERVGAALLESPGERVVTCFEVVEHLASFLPLLEWALPLAAERDCTFLLSVPNDEFWAIENPHHLGSWGEGALQELLTLLPGERTTLRQVALSGSALLDAESSPATYAVEVQAGGPATVASHFLLAFGPRHAELERGAIAVQTEMLEQRRWERTRESNLALAQRQVLAQQRELEVRNRWFEEWRTYIHELERELKRPLSGVSEDALPDGSPADSGPAAGEPSREPHA